MAKIRATVACGPCQMPGLTAKEEKERYARGYGFRKPIPARSPVQGYDYSYITESEYTPKKEKALIKGSPHKFKHRRGGSIYGRSTSSRNKT